MLISPHPSYAHSTVPFHTNIYTYINMHARSNSTDMLWYYIKLIYRSIQPFYVHTDMSPLSVRSKFVDLYRTRTLDYQTCAVQLDLLADLLHSSSCKCTAEAITPMAGICWWWLVWWSWMLFKLILRPWSPAGAGSKRAPLKIKRRYYDKLDLLQ